MRLKFIRKLDCWLGMPLCFSLDIWKNIFKLFNFRKKDTDIVKKIIFIKLSELGAIILAYPLLGYIRREYPHADLFFVTFAENKEVFVLLENIIPKENVLIIRKDSVLLFIFDALKILKKFLREKIDIVFDLEFFSRCSAILAHLIKADKKIGFYHYAFEGLYRGEHLTHKVQYNPLIHISKTYLSLGKISKNDRKDTPEFAVKIYDEEIELPRYLMNPESKNNIEARLKALKIDGKSRLFLINPGEGILNIREWPLEGFIMLCTQVLKNPNDYIIIVGANGLTDKAELITTAIDNGRCINLAGRTSLMELMGLFFIADILISNDGGLAHLASLTPIKKLVIFGPESPHVFSPLGNNTHIIYSEWPCSPCLSVLNHRNSACKDNKCLKAIKPEYVYELAEKSLI